MYVTTFYSFKGGVGRTMALVNIAAELASRGKKVLIVDFDLEAPGLSTFDFFSFASQSPGLVDYVTYFIKQNEAPAVIDYIVECPLDSANNTSIWVMPAGKRDESYAAKLASIDWSNLYRERHGYLLFDDLRQQWAAHVKPKFDYVLIDSRTGHTDVGGICTRQLPDLVVVMFYPNIQNLVGLEVVVSNIRREAGDEKNIELLFCPSNVPDLDDEHDILAKQLECAKDMLGYEAEAALIHHYDSLDLITQPIFVLDRPKTKLAKEYKHLCDAVVETNIEDREGVLVFLEKMRVTIRDVRKPVKRTKLLRPEPTLNSLNRRIDRIQSIHPKDPKVAWALASVYNEIGDTEGEISALSIAIEKGYMMDRARRIRASRLLQQGKDQEALEDLRSVLRSDSADVFDVAAAIDVIRFRDAGWVEMVEHSPTIAKLGESGRRFIAERLTDDPKTSAIAAKMLSQSKPSTDDWGDHRNSLTLSLIASGQFGKALEVFPKSREEIASSSDIHLVFNYAMAEWGNTLKPSLDLLSQVIRLSSGSKSTGPNFHQCIALAYMVLKKSSRALEHLQKSRSHLGAGQAFSCWRYLFVNRNTMLEDLKSMEEHVADQVIIPDFIVRQNRHPNPT